MAIEALRWRTVPFVGIAVLKLTSFSRPGYFTIQPAFRRGVIAMAGWTSHGSAGRPTFFNDSSFKFSRDNSPRSKNSQQQCLLRQERTLFQGHCFLRNCRDLKVSASQSTIHKFRVNARGVFGSSNLKKGKAKKVFVCSVCGNDFPQWWGLCPVCESQGSLTGRVADAEAGGSAGGGGGAAARALTRVSSQSRENVKQPAGAAAPPGGTDGTSRRGSWLASTETLPQRLLDVTSAGRLDTWRMALGGECGKELGRVLGGGVVPGSLILVGGDPGVGKSTLLLQVAGLLAEGSDEAGPAPVLYVSGEESVEQVGSRAQRMGIEAEQLYLYSATNMERILEWIQRMKPRAVVVDSIQTVFLDEATGSAGSTSQVRECATALLHAAKGLGVTIFLVRKSALPREVTPDNASTSLSIYCFTDKLACLRKHVASRSYDDD
eukprot:TRINITY_DN2944_c0_g2_i1.p1 TRINITY_DN2944_c0_g2~~TRINITY_DN2944_c0_g2_i1.p1  ORF type:complete len:435 (+),score=49.53 TRINITY_DN2944_c0_g2_i1:532-1836(+)